MGKRTLDRIRIGAAAALAVAMGLAATPAAADVVLLKDGRILERPNMSITPEGVKVPFENGEIVIPEDQIADAILEAGVPFAAETDEDKAKLAKGLVPFDGQWIDRDKAAKLVQKRIEARKAQVAAVREHMLWRNRWQEQTKHFAFEYTVPPEVYQYYADLMEAYYDEFAKTWRIKQPKELGRLRICFYTDREKFQQIGGVGGGVLGYFRFVKPLELNFYYERLDPDQTEQVMYHEVNHYLQLLMNPEFNMPHFPGESLAEYYGSAKYDPATKSLSVGHVLEGRLSEIKMSIAAGEFIGLEKMLTTDGMYEHYSWGWSLVHFLMQDKKRGDTFVKFVKALVFDRKVTRVPSIANMRTVPMKDVWEEFKKAFKLKSPEDVKALEAEWHKYIQEELHVTSSRGLADAALHAERQGLEIKAKRLLSEAIEKGNTSPHVYRRYAEYLSREGQNEKALELLTKAVAMAPLDARMHADLGSLMIRAGNAEGGKRRRKLARELDPDDPWLALELGDLLADEAEKAADGND